MKNQIKAGIIYKIFVFLNYIFHYIIKINYFFCPIIFLWECIIIFTPACILDLKENEREKYDIWMKNRFSSFGNHVGRSLLLLFLSSFLISSSKKIYILLLGMKFDKETSNNRVKKSSIAIGGKIKEIEIKMNGNIYLQNQNDKLVFKQVLIEEFANSYIYIKTNNKSIEDQLSISNWDYPKIHNIIKNYDLIETYLFYIIIDAFFCVYIFNTKGEFKYEKILNSIIKKKIHIKFESIYILYGELDKIVKSIFCFFVIYYIYILYSMGKRILFGGYKNSFCILTSYSLSFIFMIIIIIYFILICVLLTFTILCSYSLYDIKNSINYKDNIEIYVAIHPLLSTFTLYITFYLLVLSFWIYIMILAIQIFRKSKEIKTSYYILNKNKFENENEKKSEIRYLGLDSNQKILNEYIIKDYPRNLFLTFEENNEDDNKNIINNSLNDN